MTDRRYPYTNIAPLLAHLTARQIGDLIDTPTPTVQRWRNRPTSTIPEATADLLATKTGVHPTTIWDDWAADLKRPCEHCGTPFLPTRSNHRYCRTACQSIASQRRRRADPITGPVIRAQIAAWNSENRAERTAAERRRHQANRVAINARRRERRRARRLAGEARQEQGHPRRPEDHAEMGYDATSAPESPAPGTVDPSPLSQSERIITGTADLEETAA